jgi:hypothetical protein
VIKPLEALTSEGAEAQMRVLAQSWILPNVFNVGNVVKQLIWTRMSAPLYYYWRSILFYHSGRKALDVGPSTAP